MNSTQTEIFNKVRVGMRTNYPITVENRKTFGSIPPNLHVEITDLAEQEAVNNSVIIAVLLAFWKENANNK